MRIAVILLIALVAVSCASHLKGQSAKNLKQKKTFKNLLQMTQEMNEQQIANAQEPLLEAVSDEPVEESSTSQLVEDTQAMADIPLIDQGNAADLEEQDVFVKPEVHEDDSVDMIQ